MTRCAVYCRLSKEDERAGESESIQNQRAMLTEYARDQGWEVFRVYSDEDYSGIDRTRPEWNAMLRDARAGRFQVVLCKTQSRFTRDMELVERYLHGLFPLWGIRFVAVVDHVDTAVQGGKKARQINGLVNEWYLEDLSENVRAVLDQKRAAGQYIGSFPVYGYRKDPEDRHHLLIDPHAAAVVREIFSWSLAGWGKQRIAEELNRRGEPNPTAYKRALGWDYRNGNPGNRGWNRSTVGRILKNEMYVGTLVQGVKRKVSYKSDACRPVPEEQWYRVEHAHEPIVDRAAFDAVQEQRGRRTRACAGGSPHLLAGMVFCADCGSRMIKVAQQRQGAQRAYLQCGRYAASRSDPACTRHSVRLDRLEGAVLERMRALLRKLPPETLERRKMDREGALKREREELLERLEKRKQGLQSLYQDRLEGLLEEDVFRSVCARAREERERMQERLRELEREAVPEPLGEEAPFGLPEDAERLLARLLVDRIEVGERLPDGSQEITLRWKV